MVCVCELDSNSANSFKMPVYVFSLQDDRKEGMTAFVEKRKASFQDK